MISRRQFLRQGASVAALGGLTSAMPLPAWASSALSSETRDSWDLSIGETPVVFNDRRAVATGINGSVPGPLLRFREGQTVTLDVSNALAEDTSIHWHGLLLPSNMDGVPGLSFPGIKPGKRFATSTRFASMARTGTTAIPACRNRPASMAR